MFNRQTDELIQHKLSNHDLNGTLLQYFKLFKTVHRVTLHPSCIHH